MKFEVGKQNNQENQISEQITEDLHTIEQARNEAVTMIRQEGPSLATFAGDASLRYTPSLTAQTFAFYPLENRIEVPVKWFIDKGYTTKELRWALYHELSHFMDMRKNPSEFLENFDKIKDQAKKIEKWFVDKLSQDGVPEKQIDKQQIRKVSYKAIHSLYNIFDDVYVNKLVEQEAPVYANTEEGRESVKNIYEKLGYKKEDYTNAHRHIQFTDYIMQKEMLGSIGVVSSDVNEALTKKILGMTLDEIIEKELKPVTGELKDPKQRYKIIRAFIEPIYLSLLKQDIQEQDFAKLAEKIKKRSESEGEGGDGHDPTQKNSGEADGEFLFDPFGYSDESSVNPDSIISQKQIEDILRQFKKQQEYVNKTPEERAEISTKTIKNEFDKTHNIDATAREIYEKQRHATEDYRIQMRKFWKSLIGRGVTTIRQSVRGQMHGEPNVDDYIKRRAEIEDGMQSGSLRKMPIYNRKQLVRKFDQLPEKICVRAVADMSGSMDETKIDALQKALSILLLSIKDFNYFLKNDKQNTLRVYSEAYVFGSSFQKIKEFPKTLQDTTSPKEDASIISAFGYLSNTLGSTDDAAVLSSIAKSIDQKDTKSLHEGRIRDIVFVITDGEPDDPDATRAKIDELIDKRVVPIGLQIGNVSDDERKTFESIWNKKRNEKLGIYIGPDLEKLPIALMEMLKQRIGRIKL